MIWKCYYVKNNLDAAYACDREIKILLASIGEYKFF
jgi:hypothetical protein